MKKAQVKQTNLKNETAPQTGGLSFESVSLTKIGQQVKQARERKFLTLREAAKGAEVSEQWLSDLEKGLLTNATFSKIYAITAAVGLTFVPQVK
jgi:DNA-binding XRE family transcriptional regulator